jgi:hypothetical protein
MLGNYGAKALAAVGFRLPKINWHQRARAWEPYLLPHPLLTARVLTHSSWGLQRAEGLTLVDFYLDGKFLDYVTVSEGDREVTLPVKPDGRFVLASS